MMMTCVFKTTYLLPQTRNLSILVNRIEKIVNKKQRNSMRRISRRSRIALIQAASILQANNHVMPLTYTKKSKNNTFKANQDKLRVAVDVDEGIFIFIFILH